MENPFNSKMRPKIAEKPVQKRATEDNFRPPPPSPPAKIAPTSFPSPSAQKKDEFFQKPPVTSQPAGEEIAFFGNSQKTASPQAEIAPKSPLEKALLKSSTLAVAVVAIVLAGISGYYIFWKKSTQPPVTAEPTTAVAPTTKPQLPSQLNFILDKTKGLPSQTMLIANQSCSQPGFKIVSEPEWLQTNFLTQNNTCLASFTVRPEALTLSAGKYKKNLIITDKNNRTNLIEVNLTIK